MINQLPLLKKPTTGIANMKLVDYVRAAFPHNRMYSDFGRIKQVLINLINNSFTFTDSGEVTVPLRSTPSKGAVQEYLRGDTKFTYILLEYTVSDVVVDVTDKQVNNTFFLFSGTQGQERGWHVTIASHLRVLV